MKNTSSKIPFIAAGLTGLIIVCTILVFALSIVWDAVDLPSLVKPMQRSEINIQDPFIEERENQFHLSEVIPRYDEVINAIERYYLDHGDYPNDLNTLVPFYLTQVPGVYIRSGEYLTYAPEPWNENTPPFTFSIRGHYPFPAFMHGWDLVYCPSTYEGCAEGGDRHTRVFRVNDRWIWVHSSAL